MKNLPNPNYKRFYEIYKKMPAIISIILASLVFIWSIVDVAAFSYRGSYYQRYYGIMHLDTPFLAMFIWWLIGAVLVFAAYFFTVLPISATVVRTDAILEIKEKIGNTNTSTSSTEVEELPEL